MRGGGASAALFAQLHRPQVGGQLLAVDPQASVSSACIRPASFNAPISRLIVWREQPTSVAR